MQVQKGFSLLELVITLAIAAIVIGIAAPSFSSMIQDNRLSSQSLDFISALNLARSEAIKRGTQVTLCKSNDESSCTTAGNWAQGWIVFVDTDGDNTRKAAVGSPEIILRVHGPLSGNNTLTGNRNVAQHIAYIPSGRSNQVGTLSLCDPRKSDDKSKAIRINFTGRAMVSSVADAEHDGLSPETCN